MALPTARGGCLGSRSFHIQTDAASEPRPTRTVRLTHSPGRDRLGRTDDRARMTRAPTTSTISGRMVWYSTGMCSTPGWVQMPWTPAGWTVQPAGVVVVVVGAA